METKGIEQKLKDKTISPELKKALEQRMKILTDNKTVNK